MRKPSSNHVIWSWLFIGFLLLTVSSGEQRLSRNRLSRAGNLAERLVKTSSERQLEGRAELVKNSAEEARYRLSERRDYSPGSRTNIRIENDDIPTWERIKRDNVFPNSRRHIPNNDRLNERSVNRQQERRINLVARQREGSAGRRQVNRVGMPRTDENRHERTVVYRSNSNDKNPFRLRLEQLSNNRERISGNENRLVNDEQRQDLSFRLSQDQLLGNGMDRERRDERRDRQSERISTVYRDIRKDERLSRERHGERLSRERRNERLSSERRDEQRDGRLPNERRDGRLSRERRDVRNDERLSRELRDERLSRERHDDQSYGRLSSERRDEQRDGRLSSERRAVRNSERLSSERRDEQRDERLSKERRDERLSREHRNDLDAERQNQRLSRERRSERRDERQSEILSNERHYTKKNERLSRERREERKDERQIETLSNERRDTRENERLFRAHRDERRDARLSRERRDNKAEEHQSKVLSSERRHTTINDRRSREHRDERRDARLSSERRNVAISERQNERLFRNRRDIRRSEGDGHSPDDLFVGSHQRYNVRFRERSLQPALNVRSKQIMVREGIHDQQRSDLRFGKSHRHSLDVLRNEHRSIHLARRSVDKRDLSFERNRLNERLHEVRSRLQRQHSRRLGVVNNERNDVLSRSIFNARRQLINNRENSLEKNNVHVRILNSERRENRLRRQRERSTERIASSIRSREQTERISERSRSDRERFAVRRETDMAVQQSRFNGLNDKQRTERSLVDSEKRFARMERHSNEAGTRQDERQHRALLSRQEVHHREQHPSSDHLIFLKNLPISSMKFRKIFVRDNVHSPNDVLGKQLIRNWKPITTDMSLKYRREYGLSTPLANDIREEVAAEKSHSHWLTSVSLGALTLLTVSMQHSSKSLKMY